MMAAEKGRLGALGTVILYLTDNRVLELASNEEKHMTDDI